MKHWQYMIYSLKEALLNVKCPYFLFVHPRESLNSEDPPE